jgi:lysophospholipase L1-like esterase
VWVFGGSTVWGTGAPDCETLPSHLSRLLNMSGPHVVTNFGEGAYVSTQALIRFQVLLRSGDRPDVAVFYGGYNDIWTTVYVHAGTHQEEPRIRAILEASHLKRAAMGLRKAFDGESLMFGYFLRLFDNRTEKPEDSWLRPAAVGPAEIAKALDMYFENTKITKAIADTYGIALHTYWQPNVVDKMPVSDVEAVRVESLPPELVSALRLAARIVDRGSQGVENLRRVFDGDSRTLFVDYAHLSSDGNRVVANRIASDIQAGAAAQR